MCRPVTMDRKLQERDDSEELKKVHNDSPIQSNTPNSSGMASPTIQVIKQEAGANDIEFVPTNPMNHVELYFEETDNPLEGDFAKYEDSLDFLIKQEEVDLTEEAPNSVSSLLSKPFRSRTFEEQLAVRTLGRPIPLLKLTHIVRTRTREFSRKFQPDMYNEYDWLCGCDIKNALFCFPCMLYGGDNAWTKSGITDLVHLFEQMKKHAASTTHIRNTVLNSALLDDETVDVSSSCDESVESEESDSSGEVALELYKSKVGHNRYVLNIIISCIRFCGAFELALKGHDESDSTTNPRVFKGLVNFSAELDPVFKTHLDQVYRGMTKTIQTELLQCMLEVCHEEIRKEIEEAHYLGLVVEETTSLVNDFQVALIYRYLTSDGRPVERFWKFLSPPSQDDYTVALSIVEEIGIVGGTPQRIVAQTYNGTGVMGGVQAVLKETYPHAGCVHYHAYHLSVTVLKAASVIRAVRVFFANIQAICAFFFNSPQRAAIFDSVTMKRRKTVVPRCHFQTKSISTIFEYREELIECMEAILEEDTICNDNALAQATGMLEVLKQEVFKFWVIFFHKVMHQVDTLYTQIQKRDSDPGVIQIYIENFEQQIQKIKLSSQADPGPMESGPKKRKREAMDWSQEAQHVCDIIIAHVKDRFSSNGHLAAAFLFQAEKFGDYDRIFPEAHFKATCEGYPLLDAARLRSELLMLYVDPEYRSLLGILNVFDYLNGSNLRGAFSECLKLIRIVLTVPVTVPENWKCLPTSKRVKNFLKNTVIQESERLSSLAMLSIERNFIVEIPEFNEKVIGKFATMKERRVNFLYK